MPVTWRDWCATNVAGIRDAPMALSISHRASLVCRTARAASLFARE
jgi:hypothetical protein